MVSNMICVLAPVYRTFVHKEELPFLCVVEQNCELMSNSGVMK